MNKRKGKNKLPKNKHALLRKRINYDEGSEPHLNTVIYFDLGNTLIYGPPNNRQPYADAVYTLRTLYERGYLIGLLSNQNEGTTVQDVVERLDIYGFGDYIDVITISSEHPDGNILKPDERIFDLALQKVGHPFASEKTIFITETLTHITAARDLGWRAILKQNSGSCSETNGECVTSLSSLLAKLPGPRDTEGNSIHYAPPGRVVDGLMAVPMEIHYLNASMTFNAANGTCEVDASIDFVMGSTSGNPIFDLRQTIDNAWLDGAPFDVSMLDHHNFGGGSDSDLRVIESELDAGSSHTLRLTYQLDLPAALNSSSGAPTYHWNGERLNLKFWYTDLRAGRYMDAWLPGNLIFNQFTTDLDIEIVNSGIAHNVISNSTISDLGFNHWQLSFPGHFSVCSSMLRIHPVDEIESREGSTILPSGDTIEIHTLKATGNGTNLAIQEAQIANMLSDFELSTGSYPHGNRFTVFFEGSGGMEYSGATKTSIGALEHETFHSWWGRGVQPATQNDSWIDEGWAMYNTSQNQFEIDPFDMSDPPITLCSPNAFNRITPSGSYSYGRKFFAGLAAVFGLNDLRSYMSSFYEENNLGLITTTQLESYLICKSGIVEITNFFDRFVYGLGVTGASPHIKITKLWSQQDDTSIGSWEQVEAGQDNWFYAEITNESNTTIARSVVVTFSFKSPFATPVYPDDFRNSIINAAIEFNLAPGETRTIKARWPKESIPPIPTGAEKRHGCILAEIYSPEDHVAAGVTNIGASNGKLKQRNTDIVDLLPDESTDYYFDMSSYHLRKEELARLEVIRPPMFKNMEISFKHRNPGIVKKLVENVKLIEKKPVRPMEELGLLETKINVLDPTRVTIHHETKSPLIFHLARGSAIITPDQPALERDVVDAMDENFARCDVDLDESADAPVLRLHHGRKVGFPYIMKPRDRARMHMRIKAPRNAKPGDRFTVEVIQRNRKGELIGGFDIQVNIVDKKM